MKLTTTLVRFAAALLATAAIAQATSSLKEVHVNRLENGYELFLQATEAPPGAYVVVVPYDESLTANPAVPMPVFADSVLLSVRLPATTLFYVAQLRSHDGTVLARYEDSLEHD